MEVASELTDGQHVKCPSCGKKTTYRKPTRIDIPIENAVRHNRQESHSRQEPHNRQEPAEEKRPRLKLQRPSVSSDESVNLDAQAIMRRMEMERTAEPAAEVKGPAVRQGPRLEFLLKVAAMLLVAAACFVGGEWWLKTKRTKEEQHLDLQHNSAEKAKETTAKHEAELEARRAQVEAMKAEREKAREQERLRREQGKAAREKKREDERKAKEEKSAAIKAAREKFNDAMRMFDGAVVLPWRQLAKEKRPGAVDAVFLCLTPDSTGRRSELHEVVSKAGGECTVSLLLSTGDMQELSLADLEQKMNTSGGIVHDGRFAYMFCPKENAQPQPVPPSSANPSKLRMGAMYNMFRVCKLSTERLAFETRLNVPGRKNPLFLTTVGFDELLRANVIDDALRQIAIASVGTPAAKKPPRRTVMMYDGSVIKKQMNKTLVPRNPRNHDRSWGSLATEARRQEDQGHQYEAEIERQRSKAVRDKMQQLRESATLSVSVKVADEEQNTP
ncbi:MAG: hypothetical protein IJH50_10245 [Kiritimatiellae bacterium]|nr:hypothetical protein [Kiritimatiellia bacterium]